MKKIKKYLKKNLTKDRYEHTVAVAHMAAALAMRYNDDVSNANLVKRAQLAGFLHDCAKSIDDEKKLHICDKNNIAYSKVEAAHPYLLHGKVGAYIANAKFNIEDKDILQAITWHTTGRPGMSLLEKIIFIADYIEPSRKSVSELDLIRRLAFEDIDAALDKILSNTLAYLEEKKSSSIDPMTRATYEYYSTVQPELTDR